jgi:hypothetical protein
MKKIIFCTLIWTFVWSSTFAQRSEVGGFVGGSFYLGDLNPTRVFSQTQFAAGAVYRYNLTTRWAIRGNAFWGTVAGDDKKFDNPRNLDFRSRINEFSIQAEINFFTFFTGSQHHRFTPYVFAGAGLFSFNPQGSYIDENGKKQWVDLQELGTEGQFLPFSEVKPYNLVQMCFPFGLGFKYSLNRTFSIGAEWGMRFLFTDYLDDVGGFYIDLAEFTDAMAAKMSDRRNIENGWGDLGRRGSSNKRDWYSFAGVTLTAKIPAPAQRNCPAYKKSGADRVRRQIGDF